MINGWSYRVDYPYYSWAETVVRPRIERRDFNALVSRLNELEEGKANGGSAQGYWVLDEREMTSAMKFLDESGTLGASTLPPEIVAEEMRRALQEMETANAGAMHGG
jgi:hypothetical protein